MPPAVKHAVLGIFLWIDAGTGVAATKTSLDGGVTVVIQTSTDKRADAESSASADLFWRLPRKTGEWLLYVEAGTSPDSDGIAAFYPTANADARTVLGRSGDGGVQISELNYTFRFSANRTLMLGLVDPSAWLDRSRRTNDENLHFLNDNFVNNPTIEFPDYSIGSVAHWPGNDERPEFTVVLSGSHGLADTTERSYAALLDLTDSGRGVFIGAGAGWIRPHRSLRIGGWLRSDEHAVAGNPSVTDVNYGLYAVHGWQSNAHAFNVRAGVANARVSEAQGFLAFAYEHQLRRGLFGIGIARTFLSNRFESPDRRDSTDVEMFYRIELLRIPAHVTPSVQYVANPRLGEDGQSDAVIFGVRVRWLFE